MHLQKRLFVTVIREFVAYSDSINQRLLFVLESAVLCPALSQPQTPRHKLDLAHQLLHFRDALDGALNCVKLLREPPCDIRLAADKPWVQQNIVVYPAAVLDG